MESLLFDCVSITLIEFQSNFSPATVSIASINPKIMQPVRMELDALSLSNSESCFMASSPAQRAILEWITKLGQAFDSQPSQTYNNATL
jgi:hypothetical protein